MAVANEIAALRRELRAISYILLAASASNQDSRDNYIDSAHQNQGAADAIAKGGKS